MNCKCGHGREFHEHLHPRTFCASCDGCRRFRADRPGFILTLKRLAYAVIIGGPRP